MNELKEKMFNALKNVAQENDISDETMWIIVDAMEKEVKDNLPFYVDLVCGKWL